MRTLPPFVDGIVIDTSDPQEMGRMKVWCPAIDGDNAVVENLPWVKYISPLAGQAEGYLAGGSASASTGPVSYGFWAIPKVGARVVIGFLYGDSNLRMYMGSFFNDHGNRSLPAGRNAVGGAPTSDSEEIIEPTTSNLKAQFQNKLSDPIAQTRGVYERQVAQPRTEKDDTEGYSVRVVEIPEDDPGTSNLDPQTYCITTPGRHSIIMQDNPKFARLRIKTAEGHQVIFDDANERIYVSTSRGRTWIEMDVDGHVHLYAAESISMSAGKNFNLQALGNITLSAGGSVDISAKGHARISACDDVSLSGDGGVNLTSGSEFNILAASNIIVSGSRIDLNGPTAIEAPCAGKPDIVPSHEPWAGRPVSTSKRGKNWRP